MKEETNHKGLEELLVVEDEVDVLGGDIDVEFRGVESEGLVEGVDDHALSGGGHKAPSSWGELETLCADRWACLSLGQISLHDSWKCCDVPFFFFRLSMIEKGRE